MGRRRVGRSAVLAGTACVGAFALAAPAQGADRAYELVTPVGSNVDIRFNQNGVVPNTPDGNHVCYGSTMPATPDAAQHPPGGTQMIDAYCAHRTASGWVSEWVSQPRGRFAPEFGTPIGAVNKYLSADGRRVIFLSSLQIDPATYPNTSPEGIDGYVRENGTTALISGPRAPGFGNTEQVPVAATADASRVLLTDLDGHVRVWTAGAGIEVVSRDAAGSPVEGRVPLIGDEPLLAAPGALSADGSQVFFHADGDLVPDADDDGSEQSVYVRDGSETELVSPRRGPDNTPADDITFAGAGDDGRLVYLVSDEQLTADAITGYALYRYDRQTDALTLVADGVRGDIVGFSLHHGVQDVSADGSSVFYIDDADVLHRWRDGVDTPILQLSAGDFGDTFTGAANVGGGSGRDALRVTRDGSVAVFRAEGDTPGLGGVYRWSAGGGLELLSRDGGGKVEGFVGQPITPNLIGGGDMLGWAPWGQYMTTDGAAVYFHTPAGLVPEDDNGVMDVYEWRAGQVRLISPGVADHPATYVGNSADGSTVFFTTRERILPNQDTNTGRDLYAARVGGGFPDPTPSPVGNPPAGAGPAGPGAGGTGAPPTTAPQPPSPVPGGFPPPTPLDPPGGATSAARVRIAGAALSGSGKAVQVRVRASVAGDLSVAVRRRGEEIGSAEREVDGGDAVTVSVQLPKALRERLAAGKAVRVRLRAELAPGDGGATVRDRDRAALRAAGTAKRRAGGER